MKPTVSNDRHLVHVNRYVPDIPDIPEYLTLLFVHQDCVDLLSLVLFSSIQVWHQRFLLLVSHPILAGDTGFHVIGFQIVRLKISW
ncbi:hypothetical protein ACUR5C_12920 [Aliikangiella sp. IMCC44653]